MRYFNYKISIRHSIRISHAISVGTGTSVPSSYRYQYVRELCVSDRWPSQFSSFQVAEYRCTLPQTNMIHHIICITPHRQHPRRSSRSRNHGKRAPACGSHRGPAVTSCEAPGPTAVNPLCVRRRRDWPTAVRWLVWHAPARRSDARCAPGVHGSYMFRPPTGDLALRRSELVCGRKDYPSAKVDK